MPTERQINANRRNAQKSTGPRTEKGKKVSSLNAYKHGLTGHLLLMTDEQSEEREAFLETIVSALKPVGAMEERLARSVAESHWRINRAAAIENNVFAFDAWNEEQLAEKRAAQNGSEFDYDAVDRALAAVRSFAENAKSLQLLTVYEMRLHRKSLADLRQLRELQTARRPAETVHEETKLAQPRPPASSKPPARPAAALQTRESSGLNPTNGFVCSTRSSRAAISDKDVADFLDAERRVFAQTRNAPSAQTPLR